MYAASYRSNGSQSNLSLPMDEPFQPPTGRNPHRMSMPVGSAPSGSFAESVRIITFRRLIVLNLFL